MIKINIFTHIMRTIEVNTTQNVTIEYELAPARDRIIAFLVDFIIIIALLLLVGFIMVSVSWYGMEEYLYFLVLFPIFFFYSLVSEIAMNGQSLGKKLMGLRIISTEGKEPGMMDYFTRWVFRCIDIYFSFGSIAAVLVNSTNLGQRIGDMVGNTAVIKIRNSSALYHEDQIDL